MLSVEATVSDLVVERPSRSRVFEELGIDYCCGGGVPLKEACVGAGLDLDEVLAELERREAGQTGDEAGLTDMELGELVDHIVVTHHAYLKEELPRLSFLVDKVANAHGGAHPELLELRGVFERLRTELEEHTAKEERMLFPACKELEQGASIFPFGSVKGPIAAMMSEHVDAGEGLGKMRELTLEYAVPQDACNTYRAMLDGLVELERDTHYHVFKENSILFPKPTATEATLAEG
ncbi:iron-sulfur cluster repair di-iron protein [soil metagenome]